jgi:tetraacyldisaccharide 4'-kinase
MAEDVSEYLLSVIAAHDPRRGIVPSILRGFLGGCAALYGTALEGYLAAEGFGFRRRDRLPIPVISIGNLTVGGAGKTPLTVALCRRFQAAGLRPAILSRGHGGASQEARVVSEPNGHIHLSARDAGDEPILLARLCPGVPVLVGKDRRLSSREALRRWPLDLFVLDDGFQFWQLARDLDIVLLDSLRPFDNGYPLPRGLLREPARHLARAGIAVVTRADRLDAAGRDQVVAQVKGYAPQMPIYFASHVAAGLISLPACSGGCEKDIPGGDLGVGEAVLPLKALEGIRVVAICAIAQPGSFFDTLASSTGCRIVSKIAFDDHHSFDEASIGRVQRAVAESSASAVVMTEKDAVKWPRGSAQGVDAYALRIAVSIEGEDEFLADVVRHAGLETAEAFTTPR